MTSDNRLFVLIALFLVGLLVMGLLAIGGVVLFGRINQPTRVARPATSTAVLPPTVRPTATSTITPVPPPTNTTIPTFTPTKVVQGTPTPGVTATPTVRPTSTRAAPGATPAGTTTPPTGIGGLGAVLAAIGLAGVVFVARRLRTTS
jgi:hypothetical protein